MEETKSFLCVKNSLKSKRLKFQYYLFDSLRDVEGMISVYKQYLLHLAYSLLGPDEAYLEVGTWQGKSLISAMLNNPPRITFACDNFSEWRHSNNPKGRVPRACPWVNG